MIKTANYLISKVSEFKISRFESFDLPLQSIKSDIIYYSVSDLGGIGAKFLAAHNPQAASILVQGINRYAPYRHDEIEIIKGLNETLGPLYYNVHPKAQGIIINPTINQIQQRNELLASILGTFNWLTECNLYFYNGLILFKSFTPQFKLTFNVFRPIVFNESQKSLMVEYEIYEADFINLTNALAPFYNHNYTILDNLSLSYTKTEGLK